MRKVHIPFLILAGVLCLHGCASTGTPEGGPKDVTPPRLLKTIPLQNQINFSKKRVEIYFDELISLDKPSEKIIISPPQKIAPTTKAIGNKISVLFADTLLPQTTYTIDFTDAIVDFNEKNKFGDYAFSFSTGDLVDSLCFSGTLLDASNLNPVPGILIGVHDNLNDSCFNKVPFRKISKTNQRGRFTLKGLPQNHFRVYALGDKNTDYRFDQLGESVAWNDSIVLPWTEPCLKRDTLWKDSTTIDTILVKNITCYMPNDVILRYFTEDFGRQYLAKRSRPSRNKLFFTFGYKSATLPDLKLLNSDATDWYLLEKNPTRDSLVYWITDSLVSKMDTLQLQLSYLKTDSLNQLSPAVDTIKLISRSIRPKEVQNAINKKKEKELKKSGVDPVSHLTFVTDLKGTMDIFSKPGFEWETPLLEERQPWNLYRKIDTTWVNVPFTFQKDSLHLRNYLLEAKWVFGAEYKLSLDSGTVVGLYGKTNDKYSQSFKIRKEEDYSNLFVQVKGLSGPGFVEVLNVSDNVVRRLRLIKNKAEFRYLMPGTYYLRAVDDTNGNGRWDTGNYALKRQPETVYYNPKKFEFRPNCDIEETWNVKQYPALEQKPKALLSKVR